MLQLDTTVPSTNPQLGADAQKSSVEEDVTFHELGTSTVSHNYCCGISN